MRAFSTDLRERVVAAVERGMPRAAAVTTFRVSLSTVKRWLAQHRAGRPLTPGRSTGRPRRLTLADDSVLQARLQAAPDAILDEHLAWWRTTYPDRPLARSTLDRAIRTLGWTRKKRLLSPANKTR